MGFFKNLFGSKEDKAVSATKDDQLVAISDGKMIDITTVSDETFASKALGDGVAFVLASNVVCAPCNGTLATVFPTAHAFGITRKDGVELLIHIGIDTVELKGKGFKALKAEGDTVKAGEPVVELDMDVLKDAGYDLTTMVIVTDDNGKTVKFAEFGDKKLCEVIA